MPNAFAGRHVPGRGRTRSGKTLAFGPTLLARTAGQRAEPPRPLALILVPTRELAQQVKGALTPYARSARLRPATVVGGPPIGRQAGALRGGSDVVVATPEHHVHGAGKYRTTRGSRARVDTGAHAYRLRP